MEKVIVLYIGSFPPPVRGAAIITEGLYTRLQEKNIPAARICLAGAVQDDATRLLLEESRDEFGAAVQYAGIVTGEAPAAFYAGVAYFLLPSLYRHETQCLVGSEALAARTPVIAFDHAYMGEVVGTGGYLIPADEHYAVRAADSIMAGDAAVRRLAARRQMEKLSVRAHGQIDKIVDWAWGMPS
jgi:glycosyltransferase involved in cell wall biosynthesis